MSSSWKHVDDVYWMSICESYNTHTQGIMLCCLSPQRIRATVNTLEQKRLLMDLDISMRTVDCFFTVTFYGALFREVNGPWCLWWATSSCICYAECVTDHLVSSCVFLQGDVWICMELMDTSLDKFYKKVIEKGKTIPEDILGKITVAVSPVVL